MTRAALPFTDCKLRLDYGDPPPEESFLVTRGGSAYRVNRVRGRAIHCTRWPLAEVPADALRIEWTWSPRVRRAAPRLP